MEVSRFSWLAVCVGERESQTVVRLERLICPVSVVLM